MNRFGKLVNRWGVRISVAAPDDGGRNEAAGPRGGGVGLCERTGGRRNGVRKLFLLPTSSRTDEFRFCRWDGSLVDPLAKRNRRVRPKRASNLHTNLIGEPISWISWKHVGTRWHPKSWNTHSNCVYFRNWNVTHKQITLPMRAIDNCKNLCRYSIDKSCFIHTVFSQVICFEKTKLFYWRINATGVV